MQQNPARPWKTHLCFLNPPVLLRKISRGRHDRTYRTYGSYMSNHDAPEGDSHSSSRRRAPSGMMPFGERSQIPVGVRDHDLAAVVVNEEVVVVRPLARK